MPFENAWALYPIFEPWPQYDVHDHNCCNSCCPWLPDIDENDEWFED